MRKYATLARCLSRGLVLLAPLMLHTPAGAQDRPRIEVVPRIPHSSDVRSVAFSPDGARVLSGHFGRGNTEVRLWDTATGALLRSFEGHSDEVGSVALSPDGTRVLSGSDDKTARLWSAATGALLHTFQHSDKVRSVAFSPDGARVLSGSGDKTLKLWDAVTGTLLRTFEGHAQRRHIGCVLARRYPRALGGL